MAAPGRKGAWMPFGRTACPSWRPLQQVAQHPWVQWKEGRSEGPGAWSTSPADYWPVCPCPPWLLDPQG